jgi:hypothetical protein
MTTETHEETVAVRMDERGTGIEITPDTNQTDSVANVLWNLDEDSNPSQIAALNTSDDLKFELETLTIERERLKKENRRLAEMLESIKLEEDIALLKEEVSLLGGEHEQLLGEIHRRRQSIVKNV